MKMRSVEEIASMEEKLHNSAWSATLVIAPKTQEIRKTVESHQ
jgi:hypothetical protein